MRCEAIYLELEATENEKERHKKAVSTLKFQIKLGTEKVLATQKALQDELAAAKGAVHQKEASEALLKQERGELLEEIARLRSDNGAASGEGLSSPEKDTLIEEVSQLRGRCKELEARAEAGEGGGQAVAELEQELRFAKVSWEQAEAEKELLNRSLTELRKSLMTKGDAKKAAEKAAPARGGGEA